MSTATSGHESFVIFPLGGRRFALLTTDVVELSRSGLVQKIPHTTPGLVGVLVRRGEVLPVWDVTRALLGAIKVPLKYWLITRRNFAGEEWTAIPVSGECQMLHTGMLPPTEGSAAHVRGLLSVEDQLIEVLDLSHLAAGKNQEAGTKKEGLQ